MVPPLMTSSYAAVVNSRGIRVTPLLMMFSSVSKEVPSITRKGSMLAMANSVIKV